MMLIARLMGLNASNRLVGYLTESQMLFVKSATIVTLDLIAIAENVLLMLLLEKFAEQLVTQVYLLTNVDLAHTVYLIPKVNMFACQSFLS
jgi:hypothetical protein